MIFLFRTAEWPFNTVERTFGCVERTFQTMERKNHRIPSTFLRGCKQKFIPQETEKDRQRKPKERGCPAEMIGQGQPLSFACFSPERESVHQVRNGNLPFNTLPQRDQRLCRRHTGDLLDTRVQQLH